MSQETTESRSFDQIVKGDVSIKKLSEHRYRITFSKIGKFLMYQVWDKDNVNLNKKREVGYVSAKKWVKEIKKYNEELEDNGKPLYTPTTIMETEDDVVYAFVIHTAYLNSHDQVVFTVSTKEISLGNNVSKKMIQLPIGKCYNMRFDIDELTPFTDQNDKKVTYCHYTYGHPCSPDEVREWRKTHVCPGGPQWVRSDCGTGCLSLQQDWWGGVHCADY